jgi:hypothetical protein
VKKWRAVVAGAALTATVGLAPTPADAHSSSYCGHGRDGTYIITNYLRSVTTTVYHQHLYEHYVSFSGAHQHADVWKVC